jgi:hypothetical protein
MGKIKIIATLESSETNIKNTIEGTLEENIIKYEESDNTTVTLNTKDNILIRENQSLLMTFKFDENEITENKMFIKEVNQELIIMIKTQNIICKKNYYKVEYEIIDNDKFKYILEMS